MEHRAESSRPRSLGGQISRETPCRSGLRIASWGAGGGTSSSSAGGGGSGGGVAVLCTAGVEVMLMRILGAVGAACTVGSWTLPSMELTTAAWVVSTRVVMVSSTDVMIGSSSEQINSRVIFTFLIQETHPSLIKLAFALF